MRRVLFTLLYICACASGMADTEDRLRQLDETLEHREEYAQAKENRITRLREQLQQAGRAGRVAYQASIDLWSEYRSYQYDSAYHYARRSMDLAKGLGSADFMAEARCAISFCLISAGLYKEAFDEMGLLSTDGLTPPYRRKAFWMMNRLCYDIADYDRTEPFQSQYIAQGNVWADSCLRYVAEGSIDWWYMKGQQQMKSHDFEGSIGTFRRMLSDERCTTAERAIAYSCIGWALWITGHEDEAIDNLAQSAICDVQGATRETTALCGLAHILYARGDISRATRYVQESLADANFYGARQRKIQVGEILPIIEQDRYQLMRQQRNISIVATTVAALLVLVLLGSTVVIRRQVRKLRQAQHTIEERNTALERTNESLRQAQHTIEEHNEALRATNESLREANKIKTEYIGRSFYSNAEYIKKVERLYQTVDRKIAARQYDDLRRQMKESLVKADREKMYEAFDETFLKLFPDFVERFNSLFAEADRRVADRPRSLTNEMRIFALIRLGVTNSAEIANFLDYSVNTVNTYKTRVKNKSIVGNDLFEQHIMAI